MDDQTSLGVSDDELDDLDLHTLALGVHPTIDQWHQLEAAGAGRRRRRRGGVATAVAAIAAGLVVAGAVAVRPHPDGPGVAMAAGAASDQRYLLPPDGSTEVDVYLSDLGYTVTYRNPAGQLMAIDELTHDGGVEADTGRTVWVEPAEQMGRQAAYPGTTQFEVAPFGTVYVSCYATQPYGTPPDAATAFSGPHEATTVVDDLLVRVRPSSSGSGTPKFVGEVPDFLDATDYWTQPCSPAVDPPAFLDQLPELEVTDEAGWSAFLHANPPVSAGPPETIR